MPKRKIPLKDLKKIKRDFKEEKQNQSSIEKTPELLPISDQINIAKSKGRASKIEETGMTPREIKKAANKKLKKIKNEFTSRQIIQASFNFDVGDLVSFNHKGQKEVGVICSMWIPEGVENIAKAKATGRVTLLSSVGRVSIPPTRINENLECN